MARPVTETPKTARDPLRRVVAARRRRENADRDLVDAVVAARDAGATLQQIADAAGYTRQRIFQLVNERSDTDA